MQKKIYSAVLIALIVLTVIFIFSNSMKSKADSSDVSGTVTEVVKPPLEMVVGEGKVTDHLVRKLAHFVEFAFLGAEFALLFRRFSLFSLFSSLIVAVSDETLQIFYDRGSRVPDVWIDFAGACVGFFLCLGMYLLICMIVKKIKISKVFSRARKGTTYETV